MKIDKIDYFSNYSFFVSFEIKGIQCVGKLNIEPSSFPKLIIEKSDNHIEHYEHFEIDSNIQCKEISGNNSFTLHECECYFGIIYPKAVTNGNVEHKSKKVEVYLTGISTWFERFRSFEFKGDFLKRDISIEKFKVDFSYDGMNYTIENDRNVSVTNGLTTNHIIDIHHKLCITKNDGIYTFIEIKNLTRKIRDLFSIILGASLSITHINICSLDSSAKHNSLYIPFYNYEENPLKNWHESFCSYDAICEWNLWSIIINNFFKNDTFENVWNRLIPIYADKINYWEYKVLSHVVTLEMYCAKISEGKGEKLSKEVFKELKEHLKNATQSFINKQKRSASDLKILESIQNGINGLKNTTHPTLKEKYEYLLLGIDPAIRDIISFTNEDFIIIKKLRDSVAHGLSYQTAIPGNITKEMGIASRLLILLMYLAFRELGFSDEQFSLCLYRSHSPLLKNIDLNERELDKFAKTAEFIELKDASFKKYMVYKPIVIIYEPSDNSYYLDEQLTYKVQNDWPNDKYHIANDFVNDLLPNGLKIEFLTKAYLKYGEEEVLFYSVMLISRDTYE